MSFHVLTEPWIPMSTGQTVSLLQALEQAHTLEGVQCAFPPESCAVYRLLIAFVMDALALRTRDERLALLAKGRFDMDVFRNYTSICEQEGASFDLFDPCRPFMQAAYDSALDKEPKPASTIVLQMPSGNNHVFFAHAPQAHLAPGEALRHLLTAYLFATAAAQGYPSSVNHTPCIYALHHGDTLFETLVLNLVSMAECGNIRYGKPAWRSAEGVVPKKAFADVEMLAALTWQPRRATLICGEDGLVSQLYWQQGHDFKGNVLWRDPHVPYRMHKTGEYVPLKPQMGRAFWRDLGALAASREDRYGRPPLVVENAPEDRPQYRLSVVGIVTDQASLLDMVAEEVCLPRDILADPDRGDVLRQDLAFIEDCAGALRFASKELFASKDKGEGPLTPLLLDTFFHLAHDYVYGDYLKALTAFETDEEYLALQNNVHDEALKMLLTALDKEKLRLSSDGMMLKAQAEMRRKALASYYKKRRKREDEWK